MSFVSTAKDAMLNALVIDSISAHSAFPSTTGANELSGAGYARSAATFGASLGGIRLLSSASSITIPTGGTVSWLGLWGGSTYVGYAPNAGTPQEFIVSIGTDSITCLGHGYVNTNQVVFYGDTVPAPLVEGTAYYVVGATTDAFQVAATSGGTAINLTGVSGPGCVVSNITYEAYAGGGSHTVSSWTLGLPD